jgi:hypothetical protein
MHLPTRYQGPLQALCVLQATDEYNGVYASPPFAMSMPLPCCKGLEECRVHLLIAGELLCFAGGGGRFASCTTYHLLIITTHGAAAWASTLYLRSKDIELASSGLESIEPAGRLVPQHRHEHCAHHAAFVPRSISRTGTSDHGACVHTPRSHF